MFFGTHGSVFYPMLGSGLLGEFVPSFLVAVFLLLRAWPFFPRSLPFCLWVWCVSGLCSRFVVFLRVWCGFFPDIQWFYLFVHLVSLLFRGFFVVIYGCCRCLLVALGLDICVAWSGALSVLRAFCFLRPWDHSGLCVFFGCSRLRCLLAVSVEFFVWLWFSCLVGVRFASYRVGVLWTVAIDGCYVVLVVVIEPWLLWVGFGGARGLFGLFVGSRACMDE